MMRRNCNYRKTFTTITNNARYVRFRECREYRECFYRTHGNSQELLNAIRGGKTFTTLTTFTDCHNVRSAS